MSLAYNSPEKYKYKVEIQQMMFVSGETNDPPVETTCLIEDILRGQVVELLLQASRNSQNRGSKNVTAEDIIFLIRHDKAKVNRLRTYLSWKDVRKNAKDQESGGLENTDQLLEDEASAQANNAGKGPAANSQSVINKNMSKKSKIRLPWELQFMFSEQPLDTAADEDQVDEDEKEAIVASMKRLKAADDRTRNMTKEEYVHWSECRQSSFTFRKAKRFREWCGIGVLMDGKPHDDVIDTLGFLTFEMVCSITEEALKVKLAQESYSKNHTEEKGGKEKRRHYLFDAPDEMAKPIVAKHIEEAWRRLQTVAIKRRAIRSFRGGRVMSRTQLV
ncbi:hypothetical protein BABINDRAFT_32410 [Babjeviella inositovora NRRL Y-12698]|uniref:Transcription initiation protein SPT3 n=1 Tax=Babjeviella inositovora NRRL Y-12698 TaxID=984486 RepID=A0A1E3QV60_9ASCO|nr:uncharacterized protein BABINDRAFT_32410 [Babjeviella inositovora NRRL Y-12698]ODQ81545.1 hypothetical protein BABINDRAFT_32410 [Babjeviella inositovora NRRL Y-12698]